MLTDLLLLDIETVPALPAFTDMDPVWQSLFRDKISKTVPEEMDLGEMYHKRAGILAEFGKIICISTAFFHMDEQGEWHLKVKSLYGDDEVEILRTFTQLCDKMYQLNKRFRFAGHNIREFDIPYIGRRMLAKGLSLPPYLQLQDKKPWEIRMLDTLNWWKFGDHKHYTSLSLLAQVMGVPGSKTDMDGSMVQDVYYKDRDLLRIAQYCQSDVVVTANIILRFQHLPLLSPDHVAIVP